MLHRVAFGVGRRDELGAQPRVRRDVGVAELQRQRALHVFFVDQAHRHARFAEHQPRLLLVFEDARHVLRIEAPASTSSAPIGCAASRPGS